MSDAPQLEELLSRVIENRLADVHVALPGTVESYSRTTQLATVRPAVHRPGGEELPAIQNVPVLWPRAGTGSLVMSMDSGDTVLLVFCERDFRLWRERGEAGEPGDVSLHGVNSAVAIPGFYPRSSPVGNDGVPPGGGSVTVLADTSVRLGNANATKAALHEDLLSALDSFMTDLAAWVTAVDGACGPLAPATANLQAEITAIKAGIVANSYESPSVKVED